MANKTLFQTVAGAILPKADARNEAGGSAFALPSRHALAQYAVTGCLNATFYAGAEAQLERILALAGQVDPAFVAKTAIYCRTRGYMKDTPALLCAALATLDVPTLEKVFDRVIDDGRTLAQLCADHPQRGDGPQVARQRAAPVGAPLAGTP